MSSDTLTEDGLDDSDHDKSKTHGETPYLSNRVLGSCFLALSAVLLGLLVYLTVYVVSPMTRPTSFFDELTKSYARQFTPEGNKQPSKQLDQTTVDLVVMLEYASTNIRTTGVQIAFALLAGFFLIAVGVILFAAGTTGAFRFGGSGAGAKLDLSSTAPGLLCVVLGATIIMIGITRNTEHKLDWSVSRANGYNLEEKDIPKPPPAEDAPSDSTEHLYPDPPKDDMSQTDESAAP